MHRSRGSAEGQGRLVAGQAGEETVLHHLAKPLVEITQSVQGVIHFDDTGGLSGVLAEVVVEGFGPPATAALGAQPTTGVVNQDMAHGASQDCQEVGPTLPAGTVLLRDLDEGFMDQCGGPKGFTGRQTSPLEVGDASQIAIETTDELLEGGVIALAMGRDELGDGTGLGGFRQTFLQSSRPRKQPEVKVYQRIRFRLGGRRRP